MKKEILWMPLILIAMFASASVSTRAQTTRGVRAEVPFDFIVGDKTIQAGHVTVHGVSANMVGSLAISNLDQGETALRVGRSLLATDTSDQCKLVFHKFGNRYYLAQIWTPGYKAWEVLKSKEERSLEREMSAVKNFKPEPVVLAARIQ